MVAADREDDARVGAGERVDGDFNDRLNGAFLPTAEESRRLNPPFDPRFDADPAGPLVRADRVAAEM
jgi:hypothetical protein